MGGIQSSLFTVAIALCAFSTGILSGKRTRTGQPFTYFTTFLIIETLCFVFELLMVLPSSPLKALWLGLRMSGSLLVAPCLWLAMQESVAGARPKLSSLGRGEMAVILAGMAMTLPLMQTAHMGVGYYNPEHVVSRMHSIAIHTTMLLCVFIFALQVPFYVRRCRTRLKMLANPGGPQKSERRVGSPTWLHFPLAIVITTWLMGLLRTMQCATHAPIEFAVLFAVTDVIVAVGAIYTIIRRTSSSEALEYASAEEPSVSRSGQDAVAESKYANSRLDLSIRGRIKAKLENAMSTEERYRDSLLSLRSLSWGIKENTHYVSQVINQDLNSSFYELVNQYRIEQAKRLLVDSPDQTVLEIALSVGFNSKSTFNAAFRRITGTTPRLYRTFRIR